MGWDATRGVIVAATAFYLLNIVWCLLILPESLGDHHKESNMKEHEEEHGDFGTEIGTMLKSVAKTGNPYAACRLIYKVDAKIKTRDELGKTIKTETNLGHLTVLALCVLFASLTLVSTGLDEVKDQYVAIRMNVEGSALSLLHVFMAIMLVIGNVVLTPILTHNLGLRRCIYIGIMLTITGLILLGSLCTSSGGYFAYTFLTFGAVWNPALQGSIARATPAAKQGAMQAALASVLALGMAIAPLPFAYLFKDTANTFPAAVMFLAIGLIVLATLATFQKIMYSPKKHRYHGFFNKPKHFMEKKRASGREPLLDEEYQSLE